MAYQITYEWQKERKLARKPGTSGWMILGPLVVAVALAVRLLVPQSEQVFRELLHPFTDECTASAFSDMIGRIGEGMALSEAVTAFCREIIEHGT